MVLEQHKAVQRQMAGLRRGKKRTNKNDLHDLQTGSLGVVPSLGEHVAGVVADVAGPGLRDEQRAVLQADTPPSGLGDQLAILLPHKAVHKGVKIKRYQLHITLHAAMS